jgi:4-azaleucine resistance transporter AzlC
MDSTVASLPEQTYTRGQAFLYGVRDTLPMILGDMGFSVIFGALGISAGLSPMAVMGLSLFVFAGSSQFIGVQMYGQGIGIPLIIATTLIVNLRHLLYGASLGPYVKHLPQRWLIPLGFLLTDECYAMVLPQYQNNRPHPHWYQLGCTLSMYSTSQVLTLVGVIAGTQLEGLATSGLDFVMIATFIGIVVPLIITHPMLVCAIVAALAALVTYPIPNKIGLLIAAIAGILAGLWAESRFPQKEITSHANPQ